eukprot:GFYU01007652.1.p1 GENE.GFYU01007652.1~~GFYU01007652.1.p1  ORF type:complete len:655 (+),score=172.03 GFYU01007652.1:154-1965(+)
MRFLHARLHMKPRWLHRLYRSTTAYTVCQMLLGVIQIVVLGQVIREYNQATFMVQMMGEQIYAAQNSAILAQYLYKSETINTTVIRSEIEESIEKFEQLSGGFYVGFTHLDPAIATRIPDTSKVKAAYENSVVQIRMFTLDKEDVKLWHAIQQFATGVRYIIQYRIALDSGIPLDRWILNAAEVSYQQIAYNAPGPLYDGLNKVRDQAEVPNVFVILAGLCLGACLVQSVGYAGLVLYRGFTLFEALRTRLAIPFLFIPKPVVKVLAQKSTKVVVDESDEEDTQQSQEATKRKSLADMLAEVLAKSWHQQLNRHDTTLPRPTKGKLFSKYIQSNIVVLLVIPACFLAVFARSFTVSHEINLESELMVKATTRRENVGEIVVLANYVRYEEDPAIIDSMFHKLEHELTLLKRDHQALRNGLKESEAAQALLLFGENVCLPHEPPSLCPSDGYYGLGLDATIARLQDECIEFLALRDQVKTLDYEALSKSDSFLFNHQIQLHVDGLLHESTILYGLEVDLLVDEVARVDQTVIGVGIAVIVLSFTMIISPYLHEIRHEVFRAKRMIHVVPPEVVSHVRHLSEVVESEFLQASMGGKHAIALEEED